MSQKIAKLTMRTIKNLQELLWNKNNVAWSVDVIPTFWGALMLSLIIVFAFPQYSLGSSLQEYESRAQDINFLATFPYAQPPLSAYNELWGPQTVMVQASGIQGHMPATKPIHLTSSWEMWVTVTAYSSTPDQTDATPFITASGKYVRDGIIAANFLPLGTKVRFPTIYGDKIFVVEDRMNSRYYYRTDIWMPTRWQALQFGLRVLPIEILKET